MSRVPIKGIHRVKKRLASGKMVEYHYIVRGGAKFWSSLDTVPKNGPAYFELYKEALDETPHAKGLFREIILAYLKSPEFKKLAQRSQKDMKRSIQDIDARFGDAPLKFFNNHKIRKVAYAWRDKIAESSNRTADHRITHLNTIVTWACDRGFLIQNHLLKIKKLYSVDRSHIFWTQPEIDEFVQRSPVYAGNILIAATETGLRPNDLRRLNRSHFKTTNYGMRIQLRTSKTGRTVSIPVTDPMQELFDKLPPTQLQILVGAKGLPFENENTLGAVIGKFKKQTLVRQELRLYDARGTAATRLFRAGLPLVNIALYMGWSADYAARMIETYCQAHPDDNENVLIELNKHKRISQQ